LLLGPAPQRQSPDGTKCIAAAMDRELATEERFSAPLSIAVALHADTRSPVAAPLASLQGNVPEECIAVRAPPPINRAMGHRRCVHNPGRSVSVRVTLGLGFGDAVGSSVQIDFHRGGSFTTGRKDTGSLWLFT
jgi:hypothetical protein